MITNLSKRIALLASLILSILPVYADIHYDPDPTYTYYQVVSGAGFKVRNVFDTRDGTHQEVLRDSYVIGLEDPTKTVQKGEIGAYHVGKLACQVANIHELIFNGRCDDIQQQAFYNSRIAKITFKAQKEMPMYIGARAFSGDENVAFYAYGIRCEDPTPPDGALNAFAGNYNQKITIPKGCLEAYQTHPLWSQFIGFIEEEMPFTEIKSVDIINSRIEPGDTIDLSVQLFPNYPNRQKNIIFSSSDESIISVVDNKLIAVATGTAVIKVECEGLTTTVGVTVNAPQILISSIVINGLDTIEVGEKTTLAIDIQPSDADTSKIKVTGSNDIFTVLQKSNNTLEIQGKNPGVGTVKVISTDGGNVLASFSITVKERTIKEITITPTEIELYKGKTCSFYVNSSPSDVSGKYELVVENPNIVAVKKNVGFTEEGIIYSVVSALNYGETTIRAVAIGNPEVFAECKVKVMPVSISVNPEEITLNVGAETHLSVFVTPNDVPYNEYTLFSDNPKVATVDELGFVKAINYGECIIRAQLNDDSSCFAECKVTVGDIPVKYLEFEKEVYKLKRYKQGDNEFHIYYKANLDATNKWLEMSQGKINYSLLGPVKKCDLDIEPLVEYGLFPPVKVITNDGIPGMHYIAIRTKDGSNLSAGAWLEIGYDDVTKVIIENSDAEDGSFIAHMCVGEERQFNATPVGFQNTTKNINKIIKWSTEDEGINVKKRDETGFIVQATTPGTYHVTVTDYCGLCSSDLTIIVTEPIIVKAPKSELYVGNNEKLKIYAGDKLINISDIIWTSSNNDVATVDSNGIVTGIGYGTVEITGQLYHDLIRTVTIQVVPRPATDIILSYSDISFPWGEKRRLLVSVQPDEVPYEMFKWESSNEDVATVELGGVAKTEPYICGHNEGDAIITVIAPCGKSATCNVHIYIPDPEYVLLNEYDLSIPAYSTFQLIPKIVPSNAYQDIEWFSSNPEIARVDENGLITSVQEGNATITAIAHGKVTRRCEVTVTPYKKTFNFKEVTHNMKINDTFNLYATLTVDNIPIELIQWKNQNLEIATIENGIVTALAPGSTLITGTLPNGPSANCLITVAGIDVTSISISPKNLNLMVGETCDFIPSILPVEATDKSVIWTSSDTSVITVNEGHVVAVGMGVATVTATAHNGKKSKCDITVSGIEVTSVSIGAERLDLTAGDSHTFSVTVLPDNASDKSLAWNTSNPSVIVVDNGVATALAPGTAKIIATSKSGISAECDITVKECPATSIELNPNEISIKIGESYELDTKILPSAASCNAVSWTSSEPNVATVSNGKIAALKNGTTIITAQTGNVSAECKVVVYDNYPKSINFNVNTLSLRIGQNYQFLIDIQPEDAEFDKITYASSNPLIATIDDVGYLHAQSIGKTTISVTDGRVTGYCEVTVLGVPPTSVSLNNTTLSLEEGMGDLLVATFLPNNCDPGDLTWTSSNKNVCHVSDEGMVYAVAPGTAIIRVSSSGVSASCQVTVTQRNIASGQLECVTFNFPNLGYDNGEAVTDKLRIRGVTLQFSKNTGPNNPAYYTTGSALRMYTGNKLTISADKNIERVELDFSGSYGFNSSSLTGGTLSVSPGTYEEWGSKGVWKIGDDNASLAALYTKGHVRIQEIRVYLGNEVLPVVKTSAPVLSHTSGTVFDDLGLDLSITCDDPEARVYYTLDGSVPTVVSNKFDLPVTLYESAYVNAMALAPKKYVSDVIAAQYTCNSHSTSEIEYISRDKVEVIGNSIFVPEGGHIFAVSGFEVKGENLEPGIYIVCYGNQRQKVMIK